MTVSQNPNGWNPAWEEAVYSQGRHLNRYPYHAVVGFILSHFGREANRANINIFELGCGAGNNLWFAAREGFRVAGLDGSKTAIEYGIKRLSEDGLNGDLRVGDFAHLPWPDSTFDMVLDRHSLTHCTRETIRNALRESYRILKPKGKLFSIAYSDQHPGREYGHSLGDNTFVDFTGGYFVGLGTVHFFTLSEIHDVFSEYFDLVSVVQTIE